MKIALVHDHLAQDGGAELVLKVLMEMFPQAPIFTLIYDKKHTNPYFIDKDIRTSFLQRIPGVFKRYRFFLPLFPKAVEGFNFEAHEHARKPAKFHS